MAAAIILAAGASSRLGKPKQGLLFKGKNLLEISASAALKANCNPVVIVEGAYTKLLLTEKEGLSVIVNPQWERGMGSSIITGLQEVLRLDPEAGSVIIMVCDQPLITETILNELMKMNKTTLKPLVCGGYGGTIGVPALFEKKYFKKILELSRQDGAKKILLNNLHDLEVVPYPEGSIDIDTTGDYKSLIKNGVQ